MHTIRTVAELRQVIGEEVPGIADKNIDHLDDFARSFIAKSPFLILATSDSDGRMDASPKGDAPGFVQCEDDRTLLVPDRPGNKLAYGHLNILSNPHVGFIFMIPGTPETLRVNGRAELTTEPELLERMSARGKAATLVIRVHIEEVFFHCAKAFIRSELWDSASWPQRQRISFGEMFAARRAAKAADDETRNRSESHDNTRDDGIAAAIDQAIAQDYRENL